ncbi:MAG: DUF3078 domain-containing protein [Prolixibacteraceae bacterium]
MLRLKILSLFTLLSSFAFLGEVSAQGNQPSTTPKDSIKNSINILNRLLYSPQEWRVVDGSFRKNIKGLVNHAQDAPLDTTIMNMDYYLNSPGFHNIFSRDIKDIKEKDQIQGYVNDSVLNQMIVDLKSNIADSLLQTEIDVPDSLLLLVADSAKTIPNVEISELYNNNSKVVPKSFADSLTAQFTNLNLSADLSLDIYDSIRTSMADSARNVYNERVREAYKDSLLSAYKNQYVASIAESAAEDRRFEIEQRNKDLLYFYNDSVVSAVNSEAINALQVLQSFAKRDSMKVTFTNLDGNEVSIWTSNEEGKNNFIRFYLKNMQNDSLGVLVFNQGKGNANIFIDDASVELKRISETEHKKAEKLKEKQINISEEFVVPIIRKAPVKPWDLGGKVSIGFTQTSLSNWSAGGESSLAGLFMGNYHFNYKRYTDSNYDKVKDSWENQIDIKYGINKNKDTGLRKNTDNIELNSKYNIYAWDKWYYSGNCNFRTQLAPGYNYSESETDPISKFMAPGYLTFSVGLDYKPSKNLSLLLSPLSLQATFVTDIETIDPTSFGLEAGKTSSWEPGFYAKVDFKHTFSEDLSFETKASLFTNYSGVFNSIDFNWEGKLNIQLNQYIQATVLCNARFDSDTKFPIYGSDEKGERVKVGEQNRLEFKEMFTLGFAYKFY